MEVEEIESNKKCCFNCKHFEQRTCFCRKNPPQVIMINVAGMIYPSANFPKIQCPGLDFCSYFDNENQ